MVDGETAGRRSIAPTLAQIRMELGQELSRLTTGEDLPAVLLDPAEMHMAILQARIELEAEPLGGRRGRVGQQPRRELEEVVRLRAVQWTAECVAEGHSYAEAARRLGIHERTLRSWHAGPQTAAAPVPLRGRPLAQADLGQRQAVWAWLDTLGPGVGVPRLQGHFTDLARAELDELLKEYRRCWCAEHRRLIHVLHWQRAGAVWAIDFAEAPTRIDGRDAYLLAVRDLTSGQTLLWRPVEAPTAAVVVAELDWLFLRHGAPLVLKTDNGSAFCAGELRRQLARWGVGQLFSPPRRPAYNGAIEASIGSLKRRTQCQCSVAGHPGVWTSAAVEAARQQANTSRPRRLHGRTPEQVWETRPWLIDDDRAAFQATVEQYRSEERSCRAWPTEKVLSRTEQAAVDRIALRRALVAHDLLLFRRRRIPPQITRPKSAVEG
jgi:transposase InsO family protein